MKQILDLITYQKKLVGSPLTYRSNVLTAGKINYCDSAT